MRIPVNKNNNTDYPIPDDQDCLAKTRKNGERTEKGCDVFTHLSTTEMIVEELAHVFYETPRSLLFEDVSKMVHWLAALHDIGKLTPSFQNRIYRALGQTPPGCYPLPQEMELNHAFCSQIILKSFDERFAKLAGAHHGVLPNVQGELFIQANDSRLGGSLWIKRRKEMMIRLQKELNLPNFNPKKITELTEDLVLGAVILADWLSSSMDIPYGSQPTRIEIAQIVHDAGFTPACFSRNQSFQKIFGFSPNAFQQIVGDRAKQGSIYIIESEMGSGKTEAALYLASKLLEKNEANGIYFALPTKLTSEKIFTRVESFLNKIIVENCTPTALLIHSQSWIDWIADRDGELSLSDAGHLPNSFFLSKKRALLAPFAAGTIDQALLSIINVKHKSLRAFGLSGKVVIIDEVHSYDTYTGSLIKTLVKRLEEWECTVIILSATLTREARASLLGKQELASNGSEHYPLLTIKENDEIDEVPLPLPEDKKVRVRHSDSMANCLSEALEKASSGQQVLWIENTVTGAQNVFRELAAVCPGNIELGLIHSQFPLCIREQNENYWTSIYGRNGSVERVKQGRILVGTQVLEQSIDIDADCLIMQLAPGDMMFQRMGRLWRHPSLNEVRPIGAQCETIILQENFAANRYKKYSFLPYDAYTINRTYEVWQELDQIILPKDIRPLLEATYADRQEEGPLDVLKRELEIGKEHSERLAAQSQAERTRTGNDDDDKATTRLNDEPMVDVLLLVRNNKNYRQVIHSPFSSESIVIPPHNAPWEDRKKAIKALTPCLVRVREKIAPPYDGFPVDFLSHLLWTGNDNFRPVRAAFIHDGGKLIDLAGNPSQSEKSLTYSSKLGYISQ